MIVFAVFPVVIPVDEINRNVCRNKQQIEHINRKNIVDVAGQDLCRDPRDIPEDNQNRELKAHRFGRFGFDVVVDRNGPGHPKADQHDRFQ